MVFSSATFMFVFLPIFLVAYFICPTRALKNLCLLLASLVFYAWGEPVYVLLMIFTIAANWALALVIGGSARGESRPSRALLVVAVAIDILVIGFFKYEGFVAENVNALVGATVIADLELPLPIGISFYTLQALSYVIDVWRGDVAPQRNILLLGMYVACFPQLIAGPIVRYRTIATQIEERRENLDDFTSGLRLFIVGFAKKAILANTAAILADEMLGYGASTIGAVGTWAGVIAYTFQIYFDFGGYSDMAIGLGRMLGFKYLRNFNYPYISKSVTEFWRRWHISLSSFFRDYVYIPLGGNRVSVPRHIMNMLVVWGITGLWHGASWNYVLWGLYYGVLLVGEKYLWGRLVERLPNVVRHLYTILIFVFGWALFWITDFGELGRWLMAMFGAYGATGELTVWQIDAWEYWPVAVAAIVASTPIVPCLKEHLLAWVADREPRSVISDGIAHPKAIAADSLCTLEPTCGEEPVTRTRALVLAVVGIGRDVVLIALLLWGLAMVVSGSFNPFIYFQF